MSEKGKDKGENKNTGSQTSQSSTTNTTSLTEGAVMPTNPDFDPLDAPVTERQNAKESMIGNTTQKPATEIPEDKVKPNQFGQKEGEEKKATSNSSSSSTSSSETKVERKPAFSNTDTDNMSPSQKRKEAEKIADTLMFHYCLYVPMPFKMWSSFDERKIERLAIEDKIDLNMTFEIDREYTVKEYIDGINQEVDKAFTITEDRRNAIREPLIEVLMEEGARMSAKQRLAVALVSHIGEMLLTTIKISRMNSQVLDHFKTAHAEQRERQKNAQSQTSSESESKTQEQAPPPSDNSGGGGNTQEETHHHHEETHQQEQSREHTEEHNEDVSGTDESTGEPIRVEIVSSGSSAEKKKSSGKKGGRPAGTGTAGNKNSRKRKNAISLDEAIQPKNEKMKKEIENEILGDEN